MVYEPKVPFGDRKFDPSSKEFPKTPGQPKGLKEILFSKPSEPKKKEEEKSIFQEHKEGLTPYELKKVLKSIPNSDAIKMETREREGVADKIKKQYVHIKEKDIDKHIKELKKKEFSAPTGAERRAATHERILLEKAKEKKI